MSNDDELSEETKERLQALLKQARDENYWRALLPELSVNAFIPREPAPPEVLGEDASEALRIAREGWCRGEAMIPAELTSQIRTAIETVRAHGWPTVFAFVYDALWMPSRLPRFRQFVRTVLRHDYRQIPDFWAYYIPTSPTAHGYRPHREASGTLMFSDGTPTALTTWLPMTDATPDNGCMYVIPQHLELDFFPKEELERLYRTNIPLNGYLHRARALPAKAGSVLCWNHFTKHWGSFSSSDATHPRISIAYEFIRTDLPYPEHEHTREWDAVRPRPPTALSLDEPVPNFVQRLYLIGRNIRRYYEAPADDIFHLVADVFMLGGYRRLGSLSPKIA